MNKIRILYEGLSSNLGGIETFVYNLIKSSNIGMFDFTIMLENGIEMPHQDELSKMGCKFIYVTGRKQSYFKYLKDLKKLYTSNQFDIIHINVMSYSLFERITYACKYSNAKVIVHSHNGGYTSKLYRTRFLHKIGKHFVKKYDFIKTACGEKAGKFMFGNEPFEIFNNGIDFEKFKYSPKYRKDIREELNIKDFELVIGEIAAFLEVKNHEFLIELFKEILKQKPNSKLILVGVGPRLNHIKELVKKYEIEDKVLFLGRRNDAYKIYSAMDIYIMPSFSEGLSISLCEAQINGLKCFTTDGVDRNTNISGNLTFISLKEDINKWIEIILNNYTRDKNVKISNDYSLSKNNKLVFDYYLNLMRGND